MGSVFTCKLNPCCGDRLNCVPPEQYSEQVSDTREEKTDDRATVRSWKREVCKRCERQNPIGFSVPDAVWAKVVRGTTFKTDVLCIMCFDDLATEKEIAWEDNVELFPVSAVGLHRVLSKHP